MQNDKRPKFEFMWKDEDPGYQRREKIQRQRELDEYNRDAELFYQEKAEREAATASGLSVSDPNDASEQQADTIARQVVNNEEVSPITDVSTSDVQSKHAGDVPPVTPSFESKLNSTKGGGSSLDESTRTEMEGKMGTDFSQTKIHTGNAASELSQEINAKAFTHGQDIYFGGKESPANKELLAHELVHAGQQGKGQVSRKIYRAIDQPGSIKVIQDYFNAPVTGVWDNQTTTAIEGFGVKATDHGAIIDKMITGIVGASRVAMQDYATKAAQVLPHLEAARTKAEEGIVISNIADRALGGFRDQFYSATIDQLKEGIKLVLNMKLVLPANMPQDDVPVPDFFNARFSDFKKNVEANSRIAELWPRLKGTKKEEEYVPAPLTQQEIDYETRHETLTVPPKAGTAKRNSEEIAAEVFSEFYAADSFLFGGEKTKSLSMELSERKPPYTNPDKITITTLSADILKRKEEVIASLSAYDPDSFDRDVIKYQGFVDKTNKNKTEYKDKYKGHENNENYKTKIKEYDESVEQNTKNVETVKKNKDLHIKYTIHAINTSLTEINNIFNVMIFTSIRFNAAKAIEDYNNTQNVKGLDKELEEKRAAGLADPQEFQKLIALVMDNLDISPASAGILSIHFDERIIPSKKEVVVTDYIEESSFVNSFEKIIKGDAFCGIILFERGNQKTALLSLEAFDNRTRLEEVIQDVANAQGGAVRTATYKKKEFAPNDPRIAQAITGNNAIWTDPRSVRIIQDITGAPITGVFDEDTVDHIAHWQDLHGIKNTPGVAELEELQTMFGELTGTVKHVSKSGKLEKKPVKGASYNSAIQLILDYYNFYDELEKINEEGKIDQSVVPSAPRTNQTSDEVLSMYYRKDSDAGSGREAAATYPSKFSPSLVMIGKENITSFTMLVTTIAHELVHVKQHSKGSTVPGGATELFPEMMEIRGTFGNITLPGRTVSIVSQDYYRGSYEYLKLKEMSDSKKYRKDRNELYTLYKKNYAAGLTEAQNTIDKYKKEQEDALSNTSKSVYSSESSVSLINYGNAMAVIQRHNMAEATLPLLDAAYDFVDQPYDIQRLNTLQAQFVPFSVTEWANYGDYPDTKLPEVKGTVNKDYDMIRAQLFFPLQWTDAKVSMEKTNIAAQKTTLEGELTTLQTDRRKLEGDLVANATKIANIDVQITAKKDSIKALQEQIDKINTEYDAFKKAVDYVGIVQLHDRLK